MLTLAYYIMPAKRVKNSALSNHKKKKKNIMMKLTKIKEIDEFVEYI